jgi:hypothetical protein
MNGRVRSWKNGKIRLGKSPRTIGGTFWARGSELIADRSWAVLMRCRYQRAFVDFFEDQLVSKKYDWKLLLDEFLFGGKEPLINGLVAGCE